MLFDRPANDVPDCHVVPFIEYSYPAPVGDVTVIVPDPLLHAAVAVGAVGVAFDVIV